MHLIGIDLDGTLEDSRDDMTAAAGRVRARLGLPARDAAQLRPWVNAGMERLYRACFDDYLAQSETAVREEHVRRAYEADYLQNVAVQTRLYDGIADALPRLAELGAVCCITNKPEHISRRLLEVLGVAHHFTTVIGGDTCPKAKPDPIMLRTAAERAGFDSTRGRAFMIGDTDGDIELARAFGATAVWCAWGYVDAPKLRPDQEARQPRELPEIVRAAAGR
ncbi:MAG: HAD family hydrolase [Polyangiales bacterium]